MMAYETRQETAKRLETAQECDRRNKKESVKMIRSATCQPRRSLPTWNTSSKSQINVLVTQIRVQDWNKRLVS